MNFLKKIIDEKKQEVLSDRKITPIQNLRNYCKNKNFKFSRKIKEFNNLNKPAIIAEIKQASPSKGIIKKNFDHMKIAEEYVNNDAACLSILTEKNYFLGNKKYVSDIKSKFDIPILNKDFFVDPYQIYEANKNGADCILIILNSSSDQLIKDLLFVAKEMEMDVVMGEGEIETLTLTANAQPALMATSIAAMRALEAEGVTIEAASFVAGHSLGEYSALTAAGALSVADAARLLRKRGEAMQAAVPVGEGAMAAVLGLDLEAVRKVADEAAQGEVCAAANDNDPAQVVISGAKAAVERAVDLAKAAGAKRALLLPVSAPFHCALMEPAADAMAEALNAVDINDPAVPVVANVRAAAVSNPAVIRSLLVEQICGSVRWRESVLAMVEEGVTEFWEIGAGKALSGMVRRIHKPAAVRNIGAAADVKAAVESLNG